VEFEFLQKTWAFQDDDDEAWVRATVHPVVFEASYAARKERERETVLIT